MRLKLSKDLIYEAGFDDELFLNLPLIFIREFRARSMIFHLLSKGGGHKITADSGFWSKQQLEAYSKHFYDKDPLLKARLLPQNLNRICNVTRDLVPVEMFKSSPIYLEHHRYFNDDITHAIGGCFRFARGDFAIGIHRGEFAHAFDDNETRKLEYYSRSIVRMLMTRAEFQSIRTENQALGLALKMVHAPFVLIDGNLEIISQNDIGAEILGRIFMQKLGDKRLSDRNEASQILIANAKRLFEKAIPHTAPFGLKDNDEIEVEMKNVFSRTGSAQILIVFKKSPRTNNQIAQDLCEIHNFSPAEAEVALLVSDGKSIDEIAYARNTSPNTVKTQIKSIYSRLGEGNAKQTKLAILVADLRKK